MEIENIFNKFAESPIFVKKRVLQASYTPENIPHREKQIEQIASILAPSLRLEKPSNLFLYGKTGSGKTLSVKYVEKRLVDAARKKSLPLKMIYINCKLKKVADTEYRVLAELLKNMGETVPSTGLPTDHLYRVFTELLDKEEQLLILVLDEIDQAVKKIGDEFLYNFTRFDSSLSKSQISIVGISNDLTFVEHLDPRVKSSLTQEELVFPPYDALQLRDILTQRSKIAFKKGVISPGVVGKCAAYAAGEHGDARRALDLLRVAGELVEREGKKKIKIEYIDKAEDKIERDRILDVVETQPKQFQLTFLSIIQKWNGRKKQKQLLTREESYVPLFTGDIYEQYEELCSRARFKPLTQRRISDIIVEFDMLGLINARVISKGRGGRTRKIRLNIPQSLIKKIETMLRDSLNL